MVQDSGWAFRSQQMAQQAGQWAVDRETESMRQQGQSIQQVGDTIADMPDRYHRYVMQGVQRAAAPYDLQLKQRQVQLADEELRNAQQNITLNDLRRQKMVRELDLFNQMNSAEQIKLQTDLLRAQVEQTQAAAARYRQQAAFEQIGPDVQLAQAMQALQSGKVAEYDQQTATFNYRPATQSDLERAAATIHLYRGRSGGGQGGMSADTALKGIADENAPAGVRKAYEQALETADPALAQTVKQTEAQSKVLAEKEQNAMAGMELVDPKSIEGPLWGFFDDEERKRIYAEAYAELPNLRRRASYLPNLRVTDAQLLREYLQSMSNATNMGMIQALYEERAISEQSFRRAQEIAGNRKPNPFLMR